MIFSEKFITKWHDTDALRRVRISQLLVYMQEVSGSHMKACGMSLDRLRDEKGLAFILSKCALEINAALYADEEIEVETWTCEGRGYAITRFYRIRRGDEVIATAETVWALVDISTRALVRQEELAFYGFENEPAVALSLPRRACPPKGVEPVSVGQRRIVYSDLDYNMHMNNTHYPDMLCDYLSIEDTTRIKGLVLSYLREAAFGELLDMRFAKTDNTGYFRAVGEDGVTRLEAAVIFDDK